MEDGQKTLMLCQIGLEQIEGAIKKAGILNTCFLSDELLRITCPFG